MMEKITAFFKQHWPGAANAPLAVAIVFAAFAAVFLVLWLAIIFEVGDRVLPLVNAALSPTNAPLAVAVVLTALAVALFSIWLSVRGKDQMTEKITESNHWRRAGFILVVVVVALVVLLGVAFFSLWFAKKIKIGISDEFLPLVNAVLSPTVTAVCVVAGVFIWLVNKLTSELLNKFSDQIKGLINRIFKFAGAEFHEQRPVSASKSAEIDIPAKAKVDEESIEKTPTTDSVVVDKDENGAKSETAKTASAGNSLPEVKIKAGTGDAKAQFDLGVMYDSSQRVERDDKEAVKWYRRAAEQGHAIAQNNLGMMYGRGRGVKQDHAEAVKWYRRAAEQGFARAQNFLGWAYFFGEGIKQDNAEAAKWFHRAAEQGFLSAKFNLGLTYVSTEDVERNDAEAVKWFRRAAEQGHANAQASLGAAYHNGKGIAQNYWEAYIWHSIAAANGVESSEKYRDADAKLLLLSAEDLANAQAEAKRRMEEIRKRAESGSEIS